MRNLAIDGFNYWIENCSVEKMGAGYKEPWEPKNKGEVMFLMNAFFQADKEKNHLLKPSEFVVFLKKINLYSASLGNFVDDREETHLKKYALANRLQEHIDGVSFIDYLIFSRISSELSQSEA